MSGGQELLRRPLADGRRAVVTVTGRADGDLRVDGDPSTLDRRRRAVVDRPWTWLHQVHGADVVQVDEPGGRAGASADAAVTTASGAALAVHTADCVPIGLVADEGVVGAVHAGWRGLEAGVVEATAEHMRALGARRLRAVIGPCIHAECYEFGPADLDRVATALGDGVRGRTTAGAPALDLLAAATAALGRSGVDDVTRHAECTGCTDARYSHRVGGDRGRQALVTWIEP